MTLHRLIHARGPHLHLVVADAARLDDEARALEASSAGRTVARVVRGPKARTRAALFDEFAAALQFPSYFGENWDALDECLSDLDWLRADAIVLIVRDAVQVLADEPPEAFALLVEMIGRSAQGPRAIHAILHAAQGDQPPLERRLHAAGAAFDVAPLA